ncbi:hypothetical protein [Shewanella algae]|uniref:hypothetical protein n=1 Tax=Shewanella algae TaxID=38313 RepID=UPI00399BB42E
MSVAEKIRGSLRSGEVLSILYNGGSRPGTVREIVPLQMLPGDEKVKARCLLSGVTKVFAVDKISVIDADGVIVAGGAFVPSKVYENIIQLRDDVIVLLGDRPFHVNASEDRISVHKVWKNGNPQKGSVLAMEFCESTFDEVGFTDDGDWSFELIERPRTRPWSVWGGDSSNSFKYFDKAAHYFLEVLGKVVN